MISWFVYSVSPWFERGGAINNGTVSGVFTTYIAIGKAFLQGSFRVFFNYKTY